MPHTTTTKNTAIANVASVVAVAITIFIVITTLYGTWRFYSPIPFQDQWGGYIGMYSHLRDGQWSQLWAQHNEHRIVFSRLLFLVDIVLFGGMNVFTVLCNLVLLGLTSWVIWREGSANKVWRGALIAALCFSWVQKENITWGFESQCIAVYLFGFAAFAQFSHSDRRKTRIFRCLVFCGLSTVTMGNGFASFFVAATQGIIARRPAKEWITMLLGGIAATMLYFWGYQQYILPVDPAAAAVKFARIKYFAAFMGNPFFPVLGNSLFLTAIVGAILFAIATAAIAFLYVSRQVTPYRAFLIGCYGFVVISAVAASNSRWMLGLVFATSSRYTTPTLMGYAALSLLLLDMTKTAQIKSLAIVIPTAFLATLATAQSAVRNDNGYQFIWKLAVLGHKIGIEHPELDKTTAITPQVLAQWADEANSYQIGPWAKGWLHDAGLVKFDPARVDPSLCQGSFDKIIKDKVAYMASGWVLATRYRNGDILVLLVQDGQTVGYGVSGQRRPDVKNAIRGAPSNAGWVGFSKMDSNIDAYGYIGSKFCKLNKVTQ